MSIKQFGMSMFEILNIPKVENQKRKEEIENQKRKVENKSAKYSGFINYIQIN